MWIKVWTKWAWGVQQDYEFYEAQDDNDIEEIIYGIDRQHDWSDKYRGAAFEKIALPPKEFFVNEIERNKLAAEGHLKLVEKYKKLLEKCN